LSLSHTIASFYGQGKEAKNGAGWLSLCPVHGDSTPSLSITDKQGGEDVDVYCHVGCNWKDIKDRFREDGLLPKWTPEKKNGAHSHHAKPLTPPAAQPAAPDEEKKSFVWEKATWDDLEPVKKYLAGRAITIDPLPLCIKFNTYADKTSGDQVSMLVAAVSKPTDKAVYAVQRLFLDLEENRKTGAKMKGECHGRGVWFDRKGDKTEIVVGEGIETTLSAMQATGKNGVAALSTSGIKGLVIPDTTETLYILVDSDPKRDIEPKSMPGQKAAVELAKRFTEREGRKAFLVSPDDTCFSDNPAKLDFNDLLKVDPTGELIRERFSRAVEVRDLDWQPAPVISRPNSTDQADHLKEVFDRYVFLVSENKIIDSAGFDIKESLMVERAFTLSLSGKFHTYIDPSDGKEKTIPLSQHWLQSDEKLVAASTKYRPGLPRVFTCQDGRQYYNTFRFPFSGAPAMPDAELTKRLGNWHKIMDTVFHEHRSYIEDFFSFTMQRPETRAGIMPVCISEVGLGKSMVMAIMGRVVGFQNFSNAKVLDVTGLGRSGVQWGDWIYNKKLSCIEEIDPEGETGIAYKVLDALKDIITNETLGLNLKGGRNGTFPVYSNIMGFSNHRDCMKIPFGDRRVFVVDSLDQKKLSPDEYGDIERWLNDHRNIQAVAQYLMSREISGEFIPGQAKMTQAKKNLQTDGRSLMQSAFDLVVQQYPSDLITVGELQLAVRQAENYIENGVWDISPTGFDGNLNADKQFSAIMKASTLSWDGGSRVRVKRANNCQVAVRVLRNMKEWAEASREEVRLAMEKDIPYKWMIEENEVPF